MCNRDVLVLTSMPFEGTSSAGKCYDGFLPAAFRKVHEIGKGLKSNGTSSVAEFL